MKKIGDLDFILFLEIWLNLAIFSMENLLNSSKSYFPGRNLVKFRQKKKKPAMNLHNTGLFIKI
jgi:hypothetical protein